ncbi:hypothetical protein HZY97_16060 [Sphingomonas sp. R-74633]|uniref:hypothetical protein n=1 Tax=Sphingomonas sp. R-74633 TaxID=2751188 RepID=UPI0015D306DF|nr:hypothetical protein [Sphingomonas sp. R-74633]NYT42287.1 hypothetical protein [Sphingomonas sp. R-74633]
MIDVELAVQQHEHLKVAAALYHEDPRIHATVHSIVAAAMHDHGPINPDRAGQHAFEIAIEAVLLAYGKLYAENAELRAVRAERDYYEKLATKELKLAANPIIFYPQPEQQG